MSSWISTSASLGVEAMISSALISTSCLARGVSMSECSLSSSSDVGVKGGSSSTSGGVMGGVCGLADGGPYCQSIPENLLGVRKNSAALIGGSEFLAKFWHACHHAWPSGG